MLRQDLDAPGLGNMPGDRSTGLRQPSRGAVVGVVVVDRFLGSQLDVHRCVEIGLADLQMDDVFPLCFEGARPGEHFKCRLGAEAAHALSDMDHLLLLSL